MQACQQQQAALGLLGAAMTLSCWDPGLSCLNLVSHHTLRSHAATVRSSLQRGLLQEVQPLRAVSPSHTEHCEHVVGSVPVCK